MGTLDCPRERMVGRLRASQYIAEDDDDDDDNYDDDDDTP